MWVFGHLGIGAQIAAPFSRRLPLSGIFVGTLLPDLIDKPLYYGFSFLTNRTGYDIGLISCTRTLGHSALFILLLSLFSFSFKSPRLAAMSLGVVTHLILDAFQDYWFLDIQHLPGESSLRLALLFPFYESHFGDMPTNSLVDHLKHSFQPFTLISEVVGLLLLGLRLLRRSE